MSDLIGGWSIAKEDGKSTYKYTYTKLASEGVSSFSFTITGLSLSNDSVSTATYGEDDLATGIYFDDDWIGYGGTNKNVYVSKSVLSTSNVSIESGNSGFVLALGDDITTADSASSSYSWNISGTSATYKKYLNNYYTLGADSTSITYYTTSAGTSMLTLTGLSGVTYSGESASIAGVELVEGIDGAFTGTVELTKDIVGTTTTQLIDNDQDDGINFQTISLSGAVGGKVGFDETTAWSVSATTNEAYFTKTTAAGWEVSGGSVNYAEEKTDTLLTITGINGSSASAADFNIANNSTVVTLSESAIGSTSIAISGTSAQAYGGGTSYGDFTLAFGKDHSQSVQAASLVDESGTYTYQQVTTAGFSFANGGKSANYIAQSTYKFFKLEGLSSTVGVEVAQPTAKGNFTITLGASALSSANVTLTDLNDSDDFNYTLALSGVSGVYDSKFYWTGGSTAVYMKDMAAGWSVANEGASVIYTGASTGISLATITGLSAGLDTNGLSTGITLNSGVFSLGRSVLGGQSVYLTGSGYSLALADPSNVSVQVGDKYFQTATSGTLTYQFDESEGWAVGSDSVINYTASAPNQVLFTLTGLSSTATIAGTSTTFAGVSVDSATGFITVNDSVLNKQNVSLSVASGYNYSLSSTGFAKSANIDTAVNHWETLDGGSSATFLFNSQEGYSLSGNSLIYSSVSTNKFFTVEGLSSTVDAAALSAAFGGSFSEATNTIKLSRATLDSIIGGTSLKLTDDNTGDEYNFSLALAADASVGSLSNSSLAVASGKVVVKANELDYYTVDGGGSNISRVADSGSKTVATITGIKLSRGQVDTTTTSLSGTTIILKDGALNKKDISITGNFTNASVSNVFSLSFAGGGTSVYDYGTAGWTLSGTSATYQQDVLKGYTLNDGGQSISYSNATESTAVFLQLTGLSNGGVSDASKLFKIVDGGNNKNKNIILYDAAIGSESITLNISDSSTYSQYSGITANYAGYSLIFNTDHSQITGASYFSGSAVSASSEGENSVPASTSITYKQDTTAGFTFEYKENTQTANYHAASTKEFFTITGLTNKIAASDNIGESINGIKIGSDKKITLDKSVLIGHDVSLSGEGYSLSLAADDYGVKAGASYFTASASGTATKLTYQFDETEGWALSGTSVINYTAAKPNQELFKIEGLRSDLATAKADTVGGISISGETVTLSKEVLSGSQSVITFTDAEGGLSYKVALKDADSLKVHQSESYFTASASGTATKLTYQFDETEGWALSGTTINYTAAKPNQELFYLEGINYSLSNANNSDIAGMITVTAETGSASKFIVTLGASALGGQDVTLVDANEQDGITFSLSLAGGISDSHTLTPYWTSDENGNATYQYNTNEGWALSSGSTVVNYHAGAMSTPLAVITGLSAGLSAAGLTAGISVVDNQFVLHDAVLGTKNVSLSSATYSLSSAGFTVSDTIDNESYHWVVNNGAASFLYNSQAGFSYASGSLLTYSGASTTKFVTITGLSTSVDAAALSTAFGASSAAGTHTFTLTADILNKTGVTLTDENDADGVNFALSLAENVTLGTISNTTLSVSNGNVILQADVPEYYTLGDSSNVTYTAASAAKTLVTINGLSVTNGISLSTADYKTIVLGASALTQGNIQLSDNFNDFYKLSIEGSTDNWLADYGENEWKVNGTKATYKRDIYDGYNVSTDGKSVTYYGGEDNVNGEQVFMTLTGLKSGASAATFSISGESFVVIGDAAIGTRDIELKINDSEGYGNYSLSFANYGNFAHINGESYWAAGSTSGDYEYKFDVSAGFEISGLTATYRGLSTADATFTISGLKDGLTGTAVNYTGRFEGEDTDGKYSSLTGVSIDGTTITLTEDALNETNVSIEGSAGYTLALSGVTAPDDLDETLGYNGRYWTIQDNGVEKSWILNYNTGAGYSIANNEVVYTESQSSAIATLTGLNENIIVGEGANFGKLGISDASGNFTEISGLDFDNIDLSGGTVKLTSALLGSASVSISSDNNNYILAVDSTILEPQHNTTDLSWAVDGEDIVYQYGISAGFTLDGNSTALEYSASSASTIATFEGLSSVVAGAISTGNIGNYITVDNTARIFTLTNAALYDDVTLDSDSYGLSLANDVATASVESTRFDDNGDGIFDFVGFSTAFYSLSGKEIDYTPQSNPVTLVSITGLSTAVTADQLIGTKYQAASAAVEDDPDTPEDETAAAVPEVIGTITLPNAAMNGENTNISITNSEGKYKIVLADDVTTPRITGGSWEVDEDLNMATYSAKVTRAGYAVSADGKSVSYTGTSAAVDLLTIAGIGENAAKKDFTVGLDGKTVTIAQNALFGADTVSVDGDNSMGYKLAIKDESGEEDGYYTQAHEANVWRIYNSNTVNFQKVTLGYFTLNEEENQIEFTKESELPNDYYVQISGLSVDSLVTDDKGNIYTENGTTNLLEISGVSGGFVTATAGNEDEPEGTVTIKSLDVIREDNSASITNGNYKFVLDESLLPSITGGASWYLEQDGTAVYKANFSAGVDLDNTGKQVTYVGPSSAKDIAKIEGLSSNVTVSAEGKLGYMDGDNFVEGISLSGTTFTILNDAMLAEGVVSVTTEYHPVTEAPEDATAPVYKLTLGSSVTTNDEATAYKWKTSGSDFTYGNYKLAYYAVDENNPNQITYTQETVDSVGTFITISGLSAAISGDELQLGTGAGASFAQGVTVDMTKKKVTLNAAVLGTSDVTLNSTSYTLAKGSDVKTSAEDDFSLAVNDTSATLTNTPSAYYTFANKSVTYTAAGTSAEVATLTGLSSGLESEKDANGNLILYKEETTGEGNSAVTTKLVAATVDTDNAKITLTKYAVDGTNNIKVDGKGGYTLAIDSENAPASSGEDKFRWVISGDSSTGYTAKYTPYTTASYALAKGSKELTCTSETSDDELFTISGLKDVTTGNVDTIAGITVNNDKTITVSKDVLGDSEVSITGDGYTLALEGGNSTLGFAESEKWTLAEVTADSKTTKTATGTISTAEGWTLGNDKTKITHTAAVENTVTLSGLSKDIETETVNGNIVIGKEITVKGKKSFSPYIEVTRPTTETVTTTNGATGETSTTTTNIAGQILIKDAALLTKGNVSLSGTDEYVLALDTDNVSTFTDGGYQFVMEKGATTATYQKNIAAESYSCDGDKTITYHATADKEKLATITGLKKAAKAVSTGDLDGITYDNATNTFTISSEILDHSKLKKDAVVTLENEENFTGKLALGNDILASLSTSSDPKWSVKSGTGTYMYTTDKGYSLDSDDKTITYHYGGNTTLFTLTGLAKTGITADSITDDVLEIKEEPTSTTGNADSATTSTKTTYTVTLKDKSILGTSKVVLKDGTDSSKTYKLAIDGSLEPKTVNETLDAKTNATSVTLKAGKTAGFTLNKDTNTATYSKDALNTTLATISGLPKGLSEDTIRDGITYEKNDATGGYDFIVYTNMLINDKTHATSVKLKNGKKDGAEVKNTLSIDNEVLPSNKWLTDSKGNATYYATYDEIGYVQTDQTITYQPKTEYNGKKVTAANQLFKITGLSTSITTDSDNFGETLGSIDSTTGSMEEGITIEDNVITLKANVLGTSNVKVTGTGYKLALDDEKLSKAEEKDSIWTYSDSKTSRKAILTSGATAYYTLDTKGTTLKYNKPTTSKTKATITGLNLGAKEDTDFTVDDTDKVITLKANALNKTTVTLGNKDEYTLALAGDVEQVKYNDPTFSELSKNKATLKQTAETGGYSLDSDKKVTYNTADSINKKLPTLATISGVSSLEGVTISGNTVNLSEKVFGTSSITLTGNYGYKFDATNVETLIGSKAPTVSDDKLELNSNKFTLTGANTAGFTYSDANTITYNKENKKATTKLATVTGLALDKKAKEYTDSAFDAARRTLTLGATDLAGASKVTADGTGIIKFDFGSFGGGSSTVSIVGGSKDDTITSTGSNLLINTGNGNDLIDASGSNVSVNGGAGNDRITVGGSSVSVIGGAGNDSITIANSSSSVTINAGAGDDYVDMGSGSSNMFIYAAGDGNDTIKSFSGSISVASSASVTSTVSGEDLVVTITANKKTGTITLTGMKDKEISKKDSTITLTNKSNSDVADVASSPDKISDNYFDDSPQLSEVLGTSYDAVSTDEFGSSYDATQLGKQTVVYGTKK